MDGPERGDDVQPGGDCHAPLESVLRGLEDSVPAIWQRMSADVDSYAAGHAALLADAAAELRRHREALAARFQTAAREGGTAGLSDVVGRLGTCADELYEDVKSGILVRLLHLRGEAAPAKAIMVARRQLKELIAGLPEQVALECPRPASRVRDWLIRMRVAGPTRRIAIPTAEIARHHTATAVFARLRQLERDDTRRQIQEESDLEGLWGAIRYSLAMGAAGLEEELRRGGAQAAEALERSSEIALGGMTRAEAEFERTAQTQTRCVAETTGRIAECLETALAGIRRDAVSSDRLRARAYFRGRSELRRLRGAAAAGGRRAARLSARMLANGRRAALAAWDGARPLRESLGIAAPEREVFREIAEITVVTEETFDSLSLPAVYRRLFAFEPLLNEELLAGRGDELKVIEAALSRWSRGRASSVAVLGQRGSGKTSLINCACRRLPASVPLHRDTLTFKADRPESLSAYLNSFFELGRAPGSFDELAAALLDGPRRVAVLEGLHNIFLRRIGGFEALKQFLLLVLRTNTQVLWIVAMEETAWEFLRRTFGVDQYFLYSINCGVLTPEELEAVILSRNRLSAFQLRFGLDETTRRRLSRRLQRLAGNEEATQGLLRDFYFRRLHDGTEGNIFTAMFYWLRSLRPGRAAGEMDVEPFYRPNFGFLDSLSTNHYFALAAVVLHGQLTVAELGEVLSVRRIEAELRMQYLLDHNLLVIRSTVPAAGASYGLNPLMLLPVSRALRKRNILH